jgi:hypothetical protein
MVVFSQLKNIPLLKIPIAINTGAKPNSNINVGTATAVGAAAWGLSKSPVGGSKNITNFASGFTGGNIGNSGSGGYRGGQLDAMPPVIAAANSGAFQCKPILKIPTKKTKPMSLTKILSAGLNLPMASAACVIKAIVTLNF